MAAPFTKTVRGVEVPTVAIGVFEVDPGETEETVADAIAPATATSTPPRPTRTRRRSGAASSAAAWTPASCG
jgi:hypothetical protein